uniref:Defensin-like protein n=1 Tax=Ascaris lumbricoides TaxID=6252 RepID=A0A0M3I3R6_ASCLU
MNFTISFPLFFGVCIYLLVSSLQFTSAHQRSKSAIVVLPARQHAHHLILKRSSHSPNITDIRIHNSQELDNERRTLKKKRKRLRQLRDEVRELSSHVHSKRVYQGAMVFPKEAIMERMQRRKSKESHSTHSRWRKQMSSRVKAIMKRLKKIEAGLKLARNRTHPREKKRPMKTEKSNVIVTRPIAMHTTTGPILATTTNIKIKRLHSSINQSKSGESGGVCFSHKDCLCCHHISASNDTISAACFQHSLHEGDACEDSCQCEARLHCFKSAPRLLTGAPLVPPTSAICKKASTEDVVSGVYLNSKDSIFKMKPKRR